jgi:DNA-binding protein H-NS
MAKRTKTVLGAMNFEALMDLREQVEDQLHQHRTTLEKQLASLGGSIASLATGRGSAMKGRKVPAKYKGPQSQLWAGRGATPVWLREAIKGGKKAEDFLIDKAGGGKAKTAKKAKRRAKK